MDNLKKISITGLLVFIQLSNICCQTSSEKSSPGGDNQGEIEVKVGTKKL